MKRAPRHGCAARAQVSNTVVEPYPQPYTLKAVQVLHSCTRPHRYGRARAGVRHGGGAVQRDAVGAPAGGERGRVHGAGQRGAVRHLLPHAQADDAHVRRPQPPHLRRHVRRHLLPALPGCGQRAAAQQRPHFHVWSEMLFRSGRAFFCPSFMLELYHSKHTSEERT